MKQLITICTLLLCLTACKKDGQFTDDTYGYLQKVQFTLKDSMPADILKLDFTRAVQSTINSDTGYLRIPIKGKSLQQEFVLLQTNDSGVIKRGRKILMTRSMDSASFTQYNGSIKIYSLRGELMVKSDVINGYISAFHPRMFKNQQMLTGIFNSAALVQPDPEYVELPEVVVVGHRSNNNSVIFYVGWMSFAGMFGGDSGGSSGYYGSSNGYGGGASTGGGHPASGGGGLIHQEPPILIDFEEQAYNDAIEIEKYLRCFDAVSDAGAVCSVTIYADIPVDKEPNKLFNWETESPGHTFLQIKKSNGNQHIIQNIGFYPKTNWKSILTPAPIQGKFVDNGSHEFNASYTANITPDLLRSALVHISYLAGFIKYDIDEYNCTDFALEVFNQARPPANRLEIPKYDIPGGMTPYGTNTPQGLYNKLKSIQQSGSAEASDISIPGYKGWVAKSNGPCN